MDLQPIKDRLAAGTPGPWHAGVDTHSKDRYWEPSEVYAADGPALPNLVFPMGGSDLDERPALGVDRWDDDHSRGHVCSTHNDSLIPTPEHDANNRLIAHAPADLAALIAEVQRLRTGLETIGTRCTRTTRRFTCVDNPSLSATGYYADERWCDACIARTALEGDG